MYIIKKLGIPMSKQLSQITIGKILALRNLKFSYSKISQELKIPKSTIAYTIVKAIKNKTAQRKIGSGRKKIIGETHRHFLMELKTNSPKISVPQLNKEFEKKSGITVNDQIIRNCLNHEGLKARSVLKKPFLSKKMF